MKNGRAGFSVVLTVIACAICLLPGEVRSQHASRASQLFEQSRDLAFASQAERQAGQAQLIQEARRALASTPRSNAVEWGTLQLVLSMNLIPDDLEGAASANQEALRVLSARNAPFHWASAQQMRITHAWTSMANSGSFDMVRVRAEIDDAARSALSVFTVDAYPFEHLGVRCIQQTYVDMMSGVTPFSRPFSATMMAVCSPVSPAGAGMRRAMLTSTLTMAAYGADTGAAGLDVNSMGRLRAQRLAAMLDLDQLGLDANQLRRARALRAQADAMLAQMPAQNHRALRGNAQFWRTNVEMFELLSGATPVEPPTARFEGAILAPVMFDANAGVIIMQRGDGATGMQMLPGADARSLVARLNAQQAGVGAGIEAWGREYRDGDARRAITGFRTRFEPSWGAALREAARRAGVQPGGRLLILSDGPTSGLPLGLMRDPRTGRTLIEDYELVFTPSLSAYAAAQRRSRTPRAPSLAVVTAPDADPPLPSAESEAQIAQRAFGANAVRLESASKPAILDALRNASYWQFSTHGDFNWEQPRLSGLVLPGRERLILSELYFAERPLGAPNLVILSACETALFDSRHDPDEFIGLPAAFIQAGAAGVIGSLWRVDDVSTALLIARFYELHLQQRMSASAALRQAQLWLKDATRNELRTLVQRLEGNGALAPEQADAFYGVVDDSSAERPFADPYFWGGWVYFGS